MTLSAIQQAHQLTTEAITLYMEAVLAVVNTRARHGFKDLTLPDDGPEDFNQDDLQEEAGKRLKALGFEVEKNGDFLDVSW